MIIIIILLIRVQFCNSAGVYLSLKEEVYLNNSVILITEIEQTTTTSDRMTDTTSNNELQCITDKRPCCATPPNRDGEWFFPDGGVVPVIGKEQNRATTFYRSRGDDGTVNLNRVNSEIMMPTGRFCCEVPDAMSNNQVLCVNIICKSINYYYKR